MEAKRKEGERKQQESDELQLEKQRKIQISDDENRRLTNVSDKGMIIITHRENKSVEKEKAKETE